ncbi:MAG: hypothetical protein M3N32_12205 [Actinomycetota bacterium]|nr:hypothetical protein [Actinomycetota bacterium]
MTCAANGAADYRVESQYLLGAALASRDAPGDICPRPAVVESCACHTHVLGMTPFQTWADDLRRRFSAPALKRPEWDVAILLVRG